MNTIQRNDLIFLTACINPGNMPNTALQNANIRHVQYENALKWYLENTNYKILFVENSGVDISSDFSSYIKVNRLEVLTFDGNASFDKKRGKGYGEALIVKYALSNAKSFSSNPRIIKISGRIIIKNIISLVNHSKSRNDLYMNTLIVEKKNFASSKLIICPTEVLRNYFLPHINSINEEEKYYFEHCLFQSGLQWHYEKKGKQKDFFLPIFFEGVSGTSGKVLQNSKFPYTTALCKYILRCIGIRKVKFYK